jgi:hypothetical protein
MRATTLLQTSSKLEVCTQNYGPSKLQETQLWEFGSSGTKCHLGAGPVAKHKYTIRGEVVFPPGLGRGESCEFEFARGSS